jgi:hypothetical protein
MSRRVPIRLHTANALSLLGRLYRNPADAIKEHVSNAIDEHRKIGSVPSPCRVVYVLDKDRITIEYPYGMNKDEFEDRLGRVANSLKKEIDVTQVGELGIGIFSFLQIAKKCVFLTRKSLIEGTLKVTLKEGSDDAEFESVQKKEELPQPGIKITMSQLLFDPTKPRGPLSPEKLQKVFSEKFDYYLRNRTLAIKLISKGHSYDVEPQKIELPKLAATFKDLHLSSDFKKKFSLDLYFDPSGKGRVCIRHKGVAVIEDIKHHQAYGLEESVFAEGYVRGSIDADFLKPLPARSGFEENEDWISLLDELYRLTEFVEAEVDHLKQQEMEKKLTAIQKKALELASEILNMDEFKDLELLQGTGTREREVKHPPNGFDFVPPAVRADVGERAHLLLKADIPGKVPSGTHVSISVDSPDVITLGNADFTLNEEHAREGVVSERVYFKGRTKLQIPAIVTALVNRGEFKAEARIMIGEPGPSRGARPPGVEGREGRRFNYAEKDFEDGPRKHSRFLTGVVELNRLNGDYKHEWTGSYQAKIEYATLMIGKETISYNYRNNAADEPLERLLTYHFKLKSRIAGATSVAGRRSPGRPRRLETV